MFNSRILKSFVSHKIVFDGSLSEFPSLSYSFSSSVLAVCLSVSLSPFTPSLSHCVSQLPSLLLFFLQFSCSLSVSLLLPLNTPLLSLSPSPIMSFSPSFSHCLSQSNFCSYNTMVQFFVVVGFILSIIFRLIMCTDQLSTDQ